MTVALDKYFQTEVRKLVRSGRYRDTGEVLRTALRELLAKETGTDPDWACREYGLTPGELDRACTNLDRKAAEEIASGQCVPFESLLKEHGIHRPKRSVSTRPAKAATR